MVFLVGHGEDGDVEDDARTGTAADTYGGDHAGAAA
jgi:hypothetical protein